MSEALPLSSRTDDFRVQQQIDELSQHRIPSIAGGHGGYSLANNTVTPIVPSYMTLNNWGIFTSGSTFTLPVAGIWLITYRWAFAGTGGTTKYTDILFSGAAIIGADRRPAMASEGTSTVQAYQPRGATLQFRAYQDSGVNMNINCEWVITWIGGMPPS